MACFIIPYFFIALILIVLGAILAWGPPAEPPPGVASGQPEAAGGLMFIVGIIMFLAYFLYWFFQ
jgi:hypothetical protein